MIANRDRLREAGRQVRIKIQTMKRNETMTPQKLAADIFESVRRSGLSLTEEAKIEITSTCELYLAIVEAPNVSEADVNEAIETMKAVVNDWSWDGSPAIGASFWKEALKVAVPIGKELLTIAVKLAVSQATKGLL